MSKLLPAPTDGLMSVGPASRSEWWRTHAVRPGRPCPHNKLPAYCPRCADNRKRARRKVPGYSATPRVAPSGGFMIRKPVQSDVELRLEPDSAFGAWVARYPTLAEWLTASRYEDGAPRETATVVLSFEAGSFKACLNDRDNQRSLWVSGGHPVEALERLEVALCQDAQEWRAWRGSSKGPKRRSG